MQRELRLWVIGFSLALVSLVAFVIPGPLEARSSCDVLTCSAYPIGHPDIHLTTGCADHHFACQCPYNTIGGYVITQNNCGS